MGSIFKMHPKPSLFSSSPLLEPSSNHYNLLWDYFISVLIDSPPSTPSGKPLTSESCCLSWLLKPSDGSPSQSLQTPDPLHSTRPYNLVSRDSAICFSRMAAEVSQLFPRALYFSFPLSAVFFPPDTYMAHSLSSSRSLLKVYLLSEAFPATLSSSPALFFPHKPYHRLISLLLDLFILLIMCFC